MPPRYSYAKIRGMFFTITHMLNDAEKANNLLRVYSHDYPAYNYRLSREYAKALVDKYKHRRTLLLFADNRLNKIRQR